jgi:hypothetical protein
MEEKNPEIQMSKIIEDMCRKSETFQNFCISEIPKLNEKPIICKYDPKLRMEGFAIHPCGEKSKRYEIKLKRHPTELIKNGNFFLIAHEIGHLIQYEEKCPTIRLHWSIGSILSPYHEIIAALLNSVMFDYSVNAKLKEYGIEIPFICFKPPNGDKSPSYNLKYILRYVLFLRYKDFIGEGYEKEIQDCLKQYNDPYLVPIGNKIYQIINRSQLEDREGSINLVHIKPVIEEITANLKEFFSRPYEFELTVKQYDCFIDIVLTEVFITGYRG